MNFLKLKNKKGDKIMFHYDFGREKGQRPSTGLYIYTKPKNAAERQHNKEHRALLDVKKGQATIEKAATGTGFVPEHKFKANFADYYAEYVKLNTRKGNRHLQNSFTQFKIFTENRPISPVDITQNFCKRFRRYLLDRFTGETPGNYFARFKWVCNAAHADGYWRVNPVDKIFAQSKASKRIKAIIEVEDYLGLLRTPCLNQEVQLAFILCCYTGLRWVDVKNLKWKQIKGVVLTTTIFQKKTGEPVTLTLHPVAQAVIENRRKLLALSDNPDAKIFKLPSADGANKIVLQWTQCAGIDKYFTWSCARLSFSILLQDQMVDDATVAYLMGHTTTDQVRKNYKRHRPKDQQETISRLPNPQYLPFFLQLE